MTVMIHLISVSTSANGLFMCEVAFRLTANSTLPIDCRCVDKRLILFHEIARLVIKRDVVLKDPHDNDLDYFACLLLAAGCQ